MQACDFHSLYNLKLSCTKKSALHVQSVTELMYETSLITSGFTVDSPKAFADRIYSMIGLATEGRETVEPEVMDKGSSSDPWRQ